MTKQGLIFFSKMHGLGNDFMVIESCRQSVPPLTSKLIQQLANRHRGIGFDQLLYIEHTQTSSADFSYRIFNADGTEVEQCGNGARCVAQFVYEQKLSNRPQIKFHTHSGILETELLEPGIVKVNMGIPTLSAYRLPLTINETNLELAVLSIGNPHAVLRVDNISQAPVDSLGRLLESHEYFPQKTNVGFMEIITRDEIKLRVFERGVGETQACGSGACAAMVAGKALGLLNDKVTVQLPGGKLEIEWLGPMSSVWMTGPATTVFTGKIDLGLSDYA